MIVYVHLDIVLILLSGILDASSVVAGIGILFQQLNQVSTDDASRYSKQVLQLGISKQNSDNSVTLVASIKGISNFT